MRKTLVKSSILTLPEIVLGAPGYTVKIIIVGKQMFVCAASHMLCANSNFVERFSH